MNLQFHLFDIAGPPVRQLAMAYQGHTYLRTIDVDRKHNGYSNSTQVANLREPPTRTAGSRSRIQRFADTAVRTASGNPKVAASVMLPENLARLISQFYWVNLELSVVLLKCCNDLIALKLCSCKGSIFSRGNDPTATQATSNNKPECFHLSFSPSRTGTTLQADRS